MDSLFEGMLSYALNKNSSAHKCIFIKMKDAVCPIEKRRDLDAGAGNPRGWSSEPY